MNLTAEQIKGKLRNLAKKESADARILMRIFMMERFLERISKSVYKKNFIIKGGILVTSLMGISLRSTMDIDVSLKNLPLTDGEAKNIIEEISQISVDDGITFEITEVEHIMDEMEYPGIRISMKAILEDMSTPIKIDISTGDAITPREVGYKYSMMLEQGVIDLYTYNIETMFAEKLQTILARGILNTRMRDFYDLYVLMLKYNEKINYVTFKSAFEATCENRGTMGLENEAKNIFKVIENDQHLQELWIAYCKKYPYSNGIAYSNIMKNIQNLIDFI